MLRGSLVALITPFDARGDVDEAALVRLVHHHLEHGTEGLVPLGTSGESAALSEAERERVLRLVVDTVDRRLPVVAGCGANDTATARRHHARAAELGADAALHVCGYYNRPNQEGIYRHFEALSADGALPIVVYNVPPRTVVDIEVDTLVRIAALPGVIGVKDASADLARPCLERRRIDASFAFLSGEDATAVAYNASGGGGCVSVTANVAPGACASMQRACRDGDFAAAMAIQDRLTPLHAALFTEPSPAGVKYACARIGLCRPDCRLPMVALRASTTAAIDAALEALEPSAVHGSATSPTPTRDEGVPA